MFVVSSVGHVTCLKIDVSVLHRFHSMLLFLLYHSLVDCCLVTYLNANEGLGSYIFTNNVQRSWRVAEALEYGLVGVNEGVISTEVHLIPYQIRYKWRYVC